MCRACVETWQKSQQRIIWDCSGPCFQINEQCTHCFLSEKTITPVCVFQCHFSLKSLKTTIPFLYGVLFFVPIAIMYPPIRSVAYKWTLSESNGTSLLSASRKHTSKICLPCRQVKTFSKYKTKNTIRKCDVGEELLLQFKLRKLIKTNTVLSQAPGS